MVRYGATLFPYNTELKTFLQLRKFLRILIFHDIFNGNKIQEVDE
jgi:hypothetical protein